MIYYNYVYTLALPCSVPGCFSASSLASRACHLIVTATTITPLCWADTFHQCLALLCHTSHTASLSAGTRTQPCSSSPFCGCLHSTRRLPQDHTVAFQLDVLLLVRKALRSGCPRALQQPLATAESTSASPQETQSLKTHSWGYGEER